MADHRLQVILAAKDISKQALNGFEARFKRIGGVLTSFKGAIAAAVGIGGVAGLGALIQRSLDSADAIAKTADKIGLATDQLQIYQFAASQSGVATRTMDMALQRFSRRVAEAVQGKGELKDVLAQYGIEVRDANGRTRETTDILGDLAEVIKNTRDEKERLRIAFKAFDSEGVAVINTLRDGREGLKKYSDEAQRLGLVIEEGVLRKAERTNDAVDKLKRSMQAAFTTVVVNNVDNLTAGIESLATAMAKVAKYAGLRSVFATYTEGLKLAAEGLIDLKTFDQAALLERQEMVDQARELQGLIGRQSGGFQGSLAPGRPEFTGRMEGLLDLDAFKRASTEERQKMVEKVRALLNVADSEGAKRGLLGANALAAEREEIDSIIDGLRRMKQVDAALQREFAAVDAYDGPPLLPLPEVTPVTAQRVETYIEELQRLASEKMQREGMLDLFFGDVDAAGDAMAARGAAIDSALDDYFGELDRMKNETEESFEALSGLSEQTAGAMQQNFSGLFFDIWKGELDSASDYFNAFTDTIARAWADLAAQMLTEGLFGDLPKVTAGGGGLFTGLFGALGKLLPGGGGATMSTETALALVKHAGGQVDGSGPVRSVPAALFDTAPRLHNGLMADEYPAILQRGETVLPASVPVKASGDRVQVIVNNQSGQPADVREQKGPGNIRQLIVDIGRGAITSGQWDRAAGDAWGAKRQGRLG